MNLHHLPLAHLENAHEVVLDLSPVDPDLVVEGSPRTGYRQWGSWSGMEIGVWEMSPGSMRDVETDEVFLVVAGKATLLRQVDGETRIDQLSPGVVGVLRGGEQTQWNVTESLRKVYLTPVVTPEATDDPRNV